jgi:hypothetical protein
LDRRPACISDGDAKSTHLQIWLSDILPAQCRAYREGLAYEVETENRGHAKMSELLFPEMCPVHGYGSLPNYVWLL